MMFIDNVLEHLQESPKRTSRSTITMQTKINKATGLLSSVEARKKNDPLYKRMLYYRDEYYKYRDMIHRKYGPRMKSKARR
jgi:hypothetical protein